MGRFSNLEFERREPFRFEGGEELLSDAYHLRAARQHVEGARFEPALKSFSRALELNPNQTAGWVGQVQMLIELSEPREAELWAAKALELFKDDPDLLSAKAVACGRQGEVRRAAELSDSALAQKGTTAYVWLARGDVLLSAGKPNSDFCFDKGIDGWFPCLQAARISHFWGRYGQALEYASRAVDRDSTQPFAWLVLGDCHLAHGFNGRAEHDYQKAISIDPGFEPAQNSLAWLQRAGFTRRAWERIRGFFRRSRML